MAQLNRRAEPSDFTAQTGSSSKLDQSATIRRPALMPKPQFGTAVMRRYESDEEEEAAAAASRQSVKRATEKRDIHFHKAQRRK